MINHQVFDQHEFWTAFKYDLDNARARVIIESPFINSWRLKTIEWSLRNAIKRGVVVCVFLQKETASSRGSQPSDPLALQERALLIEKLRSWGVHVNERKNVHSKVAIIDDKILWDGSLNILCHYGKAKERMNRFVDRDEVKLAIQKQEFWNCERCLHNLSRFAALRNLTEEGDWGRVLKGQREWQDRTQIEVAQLCGIDRTNLSKIENGRDSSFKNILSVSKAIDAEFMLIPTYLASYVGNALERATTEGPEDPPDRNPPTKPRR
ncbi:MAG: helix-turn-helix domain-containing protein [Candidatus Melainabacteria bacterium]|nr:helix-turn-helix domain-containing protein [Candidatus Melainabacteria bacterium]